VAAENTTETRWYVPCGCDQHGDHLGCDQSCKEYGGGCQHPLGVEVSAATEAEANAHVHGPNCWATTTPPAAIDIEHELRYEWWLNHGHDGLYGDDGEMQCGRCPADFKRQPLEELQALVLAGRMERAAKAWQKLQADSAGTDACVFRAAIREALDVMGSATDTELGQGGIARRAYGLLHHAYFGTPDHDAVVREQEALRDLRVAVAHVIADSPGTPDSVKTYLRRALSGAVSHVPATTTKTLGADQPAYVLRRTLGPFAQGTPATIIHEGGNGVVGVLVNGSAFTVSKDDLAPAGPVGAADDPIVAQ